VWAFAALAPLAGAAIARVVPRPARPTPAPRGGQPLLPRAAVRPGLALALGTVGYATLAGFLSCTSTSAGSATAPRCSPRSRARSSSRGRARRLPDRLGRADHRGGRRARQAPACAHRGRRRRCRSRSPARC
jgi:hypothetical protein